MKKDKKIESCSSSSEDEDKDDDEDEDDQEEASTFSSSSSSSNELMELIRGVKNMIVKIRSKGMPIIMFTEKRKSKEKRGWFGFSDFD